ICVGPIKVLEVFKDGFESDVLPHNPTPVCSYCLVVGGERDRMVVTPDVFCAERELAGFLRQKAINGRNSQQNGELDCTVACHSQLVDGKAAMLICLLRPRKIEFCSMSLTSLGLQEALRVNELVFRAEKSDILMPD